MRVRSLLLSSLSLPLTHTTPHSHALGQGVSVAVVGGEGSVGFVDL